jgi:hypothetical protein
MTYEEALEEIEARVEEIGGIGKHKESSAAWRSYFMALEALEKLEAAAREMQSIIRKVGNGIYRITE